MPAAQAGAEKGAGLPSLLTEEALAKRALPPAVRRKAQQPPGVIPLPNAMEARPARCVQALRKGLLSLWGCVCRTPICKLGVILCNAPR